MKSVSVSLDQLKVNTNFEDVIKETLDDRLIYNDGLESLKSSQLFALYAGDAQIGFFSIDDLNDCVEAHAYVFRDYRKHSISALRYIVASQDKPIKTSVYGTHQHVIKFLQKMGFITVETLPSALMKGGELYDVVELFYKGE
ncbi:MAG: hypothetical protein ACRC6V_05115 [Bacteroidales bacterium]